MRSAPFAGITSRNAFPECASAHIRDPPPTVSAAPVSLWRFSLGEPSPLPSAPAVSPLGDPRRSPWRRPCLPLATFAAPVSDRRCSPWRPSPLPSATAILRIGTTPFIDERSITSWHGGVGNTTDGGVNMTRRDCDRRLLLSALTVAPLAALLRPAAAMGQARKDLPPLMQPSERTKAAFLARARALRSKPSGRATRDMAPSSCATAWWWARGATMSSSRATPRPTRSSLRCATPHAGSTIATSPIATSTRRRPRAQCARAPCTGRGSAGFTPRARRTAAWHPSLAASVWTPQSDSDLMPTCISACIASVP